MKILSVCAVAIGLSISSINAFAGQIICTAIPYEIARQGVIRAVAELNSQIGNKQIASFEIIHENTAFIRACAAVN